MGITRSSPVLTPNWRINADHAHRAPRACKCGLLAEAVVRLNMAMATSADCGRGNYLDAQHFLTQKNLARAIEVLEAYLYPNGIPAYVRAVERAYA
jgi:hypothetical protein